MGKTQIEELIRTRKPIQEIILRGAGHQFYPGPECLSRTEVRTGFRVIQVGGFEPRLDSGRPVRKRGPYVRPQDQAKVSLPDQQKAFPATVSDVLPQVDPATRTLKVRLEADNPGYALRPDMFVDVEFSL